MNYSHFMQSASNFRIWRDITIYFQGYIGLKSWDWLDHGRVFLSLVPFPIFCSCPSAQSTGESHFRMGDLLTFADWNNNTLCAVIKYHEKWYRRLQNQLQDQVELQWSIQCVCVWVCMWVFTHPHTHTHTKKLLLAKGSNLNTTS